MNCTLPIKISKKSIITVLKYQFRPSRRFRTPLILQMHAKTFLNLILNHGKKLDLSTNQFPNIGYDLGETLHIQPTNKSKEIFNNSPEGIIIISSLPWTNNGLVNEFKNNKRNLDQFLFYDSVELDNKKIEIISTYIWSKLPLNSMFERASSGLCVLEQYLLLMFASTVLDLKMTVAYHEDTRGCPFDYCNEVANIDETFRIGRICDECEKVIQKAVYEKQLSVHQVQLKHIFNRAFNYLDMNTI